MAKVKAQDTSPLREQVRNSPLLWFAVHSRIIDKEGHKVRPKPNIAQIRFAEAVEYCLANGLPCRIIMVKPRKVGISTFAMAVTYWLMRKYLRFFAAIIADKDERTDILYNILKFFAANDDFAWEDGAVVTSTDDEIKIASGERNSRAHKYTAGNPNSTIGETPQILAATEAAHYRKGGALDGGKAMTNALNSVAYLPDTFEFVESTAAGREGFFPIMWDNAVWPKFYAQEDRYFERYKDGKKEGEGNFIRVFVAWWEMDEYQTELNEAQREHVQRTLDASEKLGIQNYGWTAEQIMWRRDCIRDNCQGKENNFKRDFPSSPDEPFNFSGSPRFNINGMLYLNTIVHRVQGAWGVLSDLTATAEYHPTEGHIVLDPGARPTFTPTEKSQAFCRIWEEPRVGCKYVLGTDIAEDKDMNPASSEDNEIKRDAHAPFLERVGYRDDRGIIWRPRIVARLMPGCQYGHDELAKYIFLLSLFYGGCPIVPEMNNHGLSTTKILRSKFKANVLSSKVRNELNGTEVERFGHRTDKITKPGVIEKLDEAIRNAPPRINELGETYIDPHALEIFDEDALAQIGNYMIDSKGATSAPAGSHDDDVMGIAITHYYAGSAKEFTERIVTRQIASWDYKLVRETVKKRSPLGL